MTLGGFPLAVVTPLSKVKRSIHLVAIFLESIMKGQAQTST